MINSSRPSASVFPPPHLIITRNAHGAEEAEGLGTRLQLICVFARQRVHMNYTFTAANLPRRTIPTYVRSYQCPRHAAICVSCIDVCRWPWQALRHWLFSQLAIAACSVSRIVSPPRPLLYSTLSKGKEATGLGWEGREMQRPPFSPRQLVCLALLVCPFISKFIHKS